MTYLKKIEVTNEHICYAYGENKECSVGTIKISLKNTQDITFNYYKDNRFDRLTGQALMALSKFIENGNYPDEYLRATH